MLLSISYDFLPKHRSLNASVVMDHFGIGFETGRHVVAENVDLPIRPGDLVCFTGESGSGKSSLMRAAAEALASPGGGERRAVCNIDERDLPDCVLVDAIELPVQESLPLLAACGLGEAHLLLRTPAELSDGQRYRFRLALALSRKPEWIVADEFTATLDRTLAKVVSFNVRRLCDRLGMGFLLATTHEDVLPDLSPSLHVRCRLDGDLSVVRDDSPVGDGDRNTTHKITTGEITTDKITTDESKTENPTPHNEPEPGAHGCPNRTSSTPEILRRNPADEAAASRSSTNSRSRPERSGTGRISLGGIIAATGWESLDS